MKQFCFQERFGTVELYKDYDEARVDVLGFVQANEGEVVALDFSGIKFLGYSYAKATVVPAVRVATSEPKGTTRVVVICDVTLNLEELGAALEKFDQAVLVLRPGQEEPREAVIQGKLTDYLRETWQVVAKRSGATTAELAEEIGESLQNTNQRLKRLDSLGLIRRVKVTSPSGGFEWRNKVL